MNGTHPVFSTFLLPITLRNDTYDSALFLGDVFQNLKDLLRARI
jgi:hypothetical protein